MNGSSSGQKKVKFYLVVWYWWVCWVTFNKSTMWFMNPGMKSQSAYVCVCIFFSLLVPSLFSLTLFCLTSVEWLLLLPFKRLHSMGPKCTCYARIFGWRWLYRKTVEMHHHHTHNVYVESERERIELKQRIYQMASITERNITLFAILCILVGALSCTLCTFLPVIPCRMCRMCVCAHVCVYNLCLVRLLVCFVCFIAFSACTGIYRSLQSLIQATTHQLKTAINVFIAFSSVFAFLPRSFFYSRLLLIFYIFFLFVIWASSIHSITWWSSYFAYSKINNAQSSIKHKTPQACDKGSLYIPKNMCLYAHYNALAHTAILCCWFVADIIFFFWFYSSLVVHTTFCSFYPLFWFYFYHHWLSHDRMRAAVAVAAVDLAIVHWYENWRNLLL